MAVDYFLKIDGIEGESQDVKHKGEIQLQAWSWGMNAGMDSRGTQVSALKAEDMVCWMKANKASVSLMGMLARHRAMATAVITCRKAGKEQQDFYTITMKDVRVSNYTVEGGKSSEESTPTDRVVFNYSEIEFSYREQKQDGTLGGAMQLQVSLRDYSKIK